jgi:hypothetical protein
VKGLHVSDRHHVADDDSDESAGPLMLTPRDPQEVPPGRELSTLLDDFHHVYWQVLGAPVQQRRNISVHPALADLRVVTGLAESALGAALIDRLRSLRWQTMIDVLAAGGSPERLRCRDGPRRGTAEERNHPPAGVGDGTTRARADLG